MVGGATMTTSQLATAGTVAFTNQNQEQIDKENPNMPEIEKILRQSDYRVRKWYFQQLEKEQLVAFIKIFF